MAKRDEFYFDDCPICRTMKNAADAGREPSLIELLHAFDEAKRSGAVTGGEWDNI